MLWVITITIVFDFLIDFSVVINHYNQAHRLDVSPSGVVSVRHTASDSNVVSLDGVAFGSHPYDWTTLLLAPSYRPYGNPFGTSWTLPGVRKVGTRVWLQGLAKRNSGTVASGELVAQLPAGLRPLSIQCFTAIAHVAGAVDTHLLCVQANGNVLATTAARNTPYVSFDGITFDTVAHGWFPLVLQAGVAADRAPPQAKHEGNHVFLQGSVRSEGTLVFSNSTQLAQMPVSLLPHQHLSLPLVGSGPTDTPKLDITAG